ncbi:MAG: YdeI/OmpD-associated family protein [Bacteroidota bacterium]
MKDPHKLLVAPGKNSQADRYLKYTTAQQVIDQKETIKAYIQEAIELEKSGAKIDFKEKNELVFPEELIEKMDTDPGFKRAFESLTPGRQRSWNLHFSSAKQSSTRTSRIEKAKGKIFEGKGWNEY